MAHSFHPIYGALEIDVCFIYGNFAVGATGAPTLGATGNKGITSVVRNSAGQYTVTLDDSYNAVLWAAAQVVDATNSDPTTVGVMSRVHDTSITTAGAGTVTFQFVSTATPGTVEDPRNGATVLFNVVVRRSSVT